MSSFYWFFKTILYIILKVFNRLEVIGSGNVPEEGGVIVAANHVSYLDPLVIGVALKRRATFMAREGLFKIPLLGAFVRSFSFPIRRGRPQPSTIKEAVKRLKRGELIVMFPEGGRSVDGSLLDAKRGVGVIAGISRMPVVPALIKGTEKVLPVGTKLLRPAKITVIFGNPMVTDNKETDKQFQERISRDIMEAIKNLKLKIKNHDMLIDSTHLIIFKPIFHIVRQLVAFLSSVIAACPQSFFKERFPTSGNDKQW